MIAADYCTTKFLFGLASRKAFFVIRQHGSTLTWKLRGKRRRVGRIASGTVSEQGMELHNEDATLSIRRVTLCLDHPTESGDTEIQILTNLSVEQATALQVAQAYGTRWTVEGAFQTLTDGPGAARSRPAILSRGVVRLRDGGSGLQHLRGGTARCEQAQCAEGSGEKLSGYHLLGDVTATYVGMNIAVPDECWGPYRSMPVRRFANKLKALAHRVKLTRYPKQKRGPKKPQPRKTSGRRNHLSTARVLAE